MKSTHGDHDARDEPASGTYNVTKINPPLVAVGIEGCLYELGSEVGAGKCEIATPFGCLRANACRASLPPRLPHAPRAQPSAS